MRAIGSRRLAGSIIDSPAPPLAFLLINKVYSPQYVLWLLPLAVLARRNWRDLLIWQAGEVFYFAMVWFYLGGWIAPAGGMGTPAYQLAIVVRLAAEVYLIVRVVLELIKQTEADELDPQLDASDPASAAQVAPTRPTV